MAGTAFLVPVTQEGVHQDLRYLILMGPPLARRYIKWQVRPSDAEIGRGVFGVFGATENLPQGLERTSGPHKPKA